MRALDPTTLEVIRNALLGAVQEMKNVVMRTAYSTLWKEAGDLSCALLTPTPEVVTQGQADIPVHLATMPYSVRGCLAKFPVETLRPGDILFQNDPYSGNNHLPDFLMVKPVFVDGRLLAFSAVRGHTVDVGGSGPGSYSTVTHDIYAEGIRISPVKFHREGVVDETLVMVLENNTRGSRERMGDLRAQLAGCWTGDQRVQALAARYGAETLAAAMRQILDHSEALTRVSLASIPRGTFRFVDHCDGDGIADERIRIEVAVTVDEQGVLVDFEGSSRQTRGGMNCPLAVTASATCYAIKCVSDPANPANSGNYRPVRILAPEGTVVNCVLPAPVIAGNHETASRIADAVLGALAQAVPDRVSAAGFGSAGILCVAGEDGRPGRKGREYICVEPHGGGQGGALGLDGAHAIRVSVGNTGNTPIESLETHFPILVERYEIIEDSAGAGRHRGGAGLRRRLRLLDAASVIITSDRAADPPYGLLGGRPGRLARYFIDGRPVPSKTPLLRCRAGAVIEMELAGGGGYGDPRERPPEAVREDVEDGFVSITAAAETYGVVLIHHPARPPGERYAVDHDATAARRGRRA